MYILDYNAVVLAALHVEVKKKEDADPRMLRHMILNSIRYHVKTHKHEYGQFIIAADTRSCWRKEFFEYYKYKRAEDKKKSKINWDEIYPFVNDVFDEISANFPYWCIKADRCEADDVIGVLVKWYHEHTDEPILILSADKDFKQLHFSSRVRQYAPVQKRFIGVQDREREKKELILDGDRGDGIPNVLSADETFAIDGMRQKKMTAGRLEEFLKIDLEDPDENKSYLGWKRNQKLIDLDYTPQSLVDEILRQHDVARASPKKSNAFNYLAANGLRNLLDNVSDF